MLKRGKRQSRYAADPLFGSLHTLTFVQGLRLLRSLTNPAYDSIGYGLTRVIPTATRNHPGLANEYKYAPTIEGNQQAEVSKPCQQS